MAPGRATGKGHKRKAEKEKEEEEEEEEEEEAQAGESPGWPKSLDKAERELKGTVDRLLSALPVDLRQAFVWRAAGLLATCEADARPPAVIAPRGPDAEETLEAIRQRLRALVGPRACAPGESFHFPSHLPEYAGYEQGTVEHVDAFLYDEGELDELVEQGKLSRHYCGPAGPRDIRPLHLLSHSFSLPQLRLLFSDGALGALAGKTLVDVGSRLGAVLWAGAAFSEAKRLVGIELSPFFDKVQRTIIDSFGLKARVQSVCADATECAELLGGADVVVMNNVFEFFHTAREQAALWAKVRALLKRKGQRLVTVPALAVSLANAGSPLGLDGWVVELPLRQPYPPQPPLDGATVEGSAFYSEALAEQNEAFEQIHLYEVVA